MTTERATERGRETGKGRIGDDPRERDLLYGRIAEARSLGVIDEAQEPVAMRSMMTGVPVAKVASAMRVIDSELAELRAAQAALAADRAKNARDRRTDAVAKSLGLDR